MKGLAWLIIAICSLALTNVGQTIWASLDKGEWMLSYYTFARPDDTLIWLTCAAMLAASAVFTVWAYYESGIGKTWGFLAGILFSTMALMIGDIVGSFLTLRGAALFSDLLIAISSKSCYVAYTITGLANTLVGIWFAKPIVVPDGDSRAIRIIVWPFFWLAEKIFGKEKIRERATWWRMQA